MTVYCLRVFNRADRRFIAVFGANAADVIRQEDAVYTKYSDREYFIERSVLETDKYIDFPDAPTDATPQEWAEFALAPSGEV